MPADARVCVCVCVRARARRLGRLLASESVSDGGGLEKCRESLRQPHRHCTAHKLLPAGLASHANVHERERLCFVLCASTVFQQSPRAGGPAAVRMTHRVPFLPLRANSAAQSPSCAVKASGIPRHWSPRHIASPPCLPCVAHTLSLWPFAVGHTVAAWHWCKCVCVRGMHPRSKFRNLPAAGASLNGATSYCAAWPELCAEPEMSRT